MPDMRGTNVYDGKIDYFDGKWVLGRRTVFMYPQDYRLEMQWKGFVAQTFQGEINKQQLIDLKRTFFAGAKGFFNLISSPNRPAEQDEQFVADICEELNRFNEDVKAGRQ
jgi:hypothetical protein